MHAVKFPDNAAQLFTGENDNKHIIVLTKLAPVTSAKDRPRGPMRTWSCSLLTRT